MITTDRFEAAEPSLVRLSALPRDHPVPALGDPDDPVAMRAFLEAVAADPLLREAIAISSAPLDGTLERVVAGDRLSVAKLRRAALAVTRYLYRMTSRATPFGQLAGVAPVRFDAQPKVRIGAGHTRHVRVDMGWLAEVVGPVRRDPQVLRGLRLVANDLCFVRADRLVLPLVREESGQRGPDDREHSVRNTAAVRAARELATTPVGYPDLVDGLAARFPEAGADAIAGLVGELVEREFLLTDLLPVATTSDPLGHVLSRIGPDSPLHELPELLGRFAAAPQGRGAPAWRAATTAMREIHASDRLVQSDLGMDAEVVLPDSVAAEIAAAASVAWQLAPAALAPADPLVGYRAEFVERYGTDTLVGVHELLDPQRGLGPPAGYLLPPSTRPSADLNVHDKDRDAVLLEVAQLAAARGTREVELDAELVERLVRPGSADERGSYLEACFHLLAASEDALRAGDFRLVTGGMIFTRIGAMFGRFLHVLPALREAVTGLAALDGLEPAQLVAPLLHARNLNVVQVPELAGTSLHIGVFAERPGVLGLGDIAIGADHERFSVVSLRDGRELVPLTFHALNPMLTMPNALRLLIEIGESRTPGWPLWHWGAAEGLPFLPRIRYGRTVLASASWTPDPRLATVSDTGEWHRLLDGWRARWSVPDQVVATTGDQRIPIDLRNPTDRELLRADLRKRPSLVVHEEPAGGEFGNGWAGGHASELVVPLRPTRPRQEVAPAWRPVVHRPQPPGGEWLYLKLYAHPARHGELLGTHLPALMATADGWFDRWFFLRYTDTGAHLRVRFRGDPDVLGARMLPAVHRWAGALIDAGVLGDLTTATYRPEISRYGGPAVIDAAERAFHADSECVLDQLRLRAGGMLDVPVEVLLAANHLDVTGRMRAEGTWDVDWRTWLLAVYKRSDEHAAFREHRRLAVRLLDPDSAWSALAELPGGQALLESWERRAPALREFGRLVAEHARDRSAVVADVLHMHHNRLVGVDPVRERRGYAIARGVLQARADRLRAMRP
ncbi:lantibiotic dehydratase [Actinomycetes bacterium KLBMP 9759]